MTNLPKPSLDNNTNFAVGNFVVLTSEGTTDILEVKYVYHGYLRVTNGIQGITVYNNEVRHATTAEVKAKRRLPQLTEFLGDDKHVENNISPSCKFISSDVHIHLSNAFTAQKEIP